MTAMVISGPRGDAAWELNRQKTIDAFNVVKDVAVTAIANVKILFGTVPQMSQPCASMGDHKKSVEGYPYVAVKTFFEKLQGVIAAYTTKPLFAMMEKLRVATLYTR
ncbi:unnamed protein product [Heligmosomoides polygyrus]|uniref:ACOX domain-containing protein n=1 Tax=Heligmosomoides polygyrus TaxID=6339 RepID=A0A183F778_HELPZ|nr:unnamed protein product [Heligmosomoides polygyrus]